MTKLRRKNLPAPHRPRACLAALSTALSTVLAPVLAPVLAAVLATAAIGCKNSDSDARASASDSANEEKHAGVSANSADKADKAPGDWQHPTLSAKITPIATCEWDGDKLWHVDCPAIDEWIAYLDGSPPMAPGERGKELLTGFANSSGDAQRALFSALVEDRDGHSEGIADDSMQGQVFDLVKTGSSVEVQTMAAVLLKPVDMSASPIRDALLAFEPEAPALARAELLRGLADVKCKPCVERLVERASDSDPEVRRAAFGRLQPSFSPKVCELYVQAIEQNDPKMALHATQTLGQYEGVCSSSFAPALAALESHAKNNELTTNARMALRSWIGNKDIDAVMTKRVQALLGSR